MLKVKCMHTKHLAKKRKTWSDGYLKVNLNTKRCVLIDEGDYREIGLGGRVLEAIEMHKLQRKEEFTMELGGFMVQIESGGYAINVAAAGAPVVKEYQAPLKLAKFVTPSTIVPKPKPIEANPLQDRYYPSSSSNNQYGVNPTLGKSYKVNNEELDDIWDENAPVDSRKVTFNPNKQIAPKVIHNYSAIQKNSTVDYESRYRPTARPMAVIQGAFGGEETDRRSNGSTDYQSVIDAQWMKNSNESDSKSVPKSVETVDDVWTAPPVISNTNPVTNVSESYTGMPDFWGVNDNNSNVNGAADALDSNGHEFIGQATIDASIWDE